MIHLAIKTGREKHGNGYGENTNIIMFSNHKLLVDNGSYIESFTAGNGEGDDGRC